MNDMNLMVIKNFTIRTAFILAQVTLSDKKVAKRALIKSLISNLLCRYWVRRFRMKAKTEALTRISIKYVL